MSVLVDSRTFYFVGKNSLVTSVKDKVESQAPKERQQFELV